MRITSRNDKDNDVNKYSILNNEISTYSKLFDIVMVVNPFDLAVLKVDDTHFQQELGICYDRCPLSKDKCGCICKDVLSVSKTKMRFSFNSNFAYLVMCSPVKMKYRDYVLVLIKQLDTHFSFGSTSANDAVKQITNLSSNLVLDELTRIFNRNYIVNNIDFQIIEAINKNTPLSLACIDIDNFKKFNDNYGHDFGDKVLMEVANCMRKAIQGFDESYPVRIGGDEFIVVGVGIPKQKFKVIMTKLCQLVQSTKLPYKGEEVGICISVGVGEVLEDHVNTYKDLYKRADDQLYEAKEAGKNCVR